MGVSTRARVSPEQYRQTFDQPYRMGSLAGSINGQYAPLSARKTPARQMNEGIAAYLRRALDWGTTSQGKSIGTVGLLSALGGGAGSYLWDRSQGDSAVPGKAMLMALLAGGIGAAGTAWGQNRHNRREQYLGKSASMDVATSLVRMLEGDPSLSRHDRAVILAALAKAPTSDREQLHRLLKSSVGAGVGILAARFLGAKGLLPMLAGGILGGIIGGRDSGTKRNAQGQISITNYF